MKRNLNKLETLLLALGLCVTVLGKEAFAGLKINLVAVNASESQTKEYPIKFALPKELTPGDIIDTGGLDLDYDIDNQAYFVYGVVKLEPKESKTIKIEVKDVWKVTKEKIDEMKKQIDENMTRLKEPEDIERGKALKDNLVKQLDTILAAQENYSDNIERRIEQFRADSERLKVVKSAILSVEYWEGKKGMVKSVPSPEQKDKTVKFIVEVENPQDNGAKTIQQKHYLPNEIRSEDIVDLQGFEVRFDEEKKQAYLSKEEEFQPGEKKRYQFEIKDKWRIPQEDVKLVNDRMDDTLKELEKYEYAKEYVTAAGDLKNSIVQGIEEINKLQNQEKTSMKQHIGAFRVNQERFKTTEEDLKKLEDILNIVRQKRLEELEKSRVKNVLQKLKSLNGIEAVSKAIFGAKPSISTTWRIIWGTLAFVAVFTALHFFTWWQRSQAAKLKELEKTKPGPAKV